MSLDNIETDNERPIRKIINELGKCMVILVLGFVAGEPKLSDFYPKLIE